MIPAQFEDNKLGLEAEKSQVQRGNVVTLQKQIRDLDSKQD